MTGVLIFFPTCFDAIYFLILNALFSKDGDPVWIIDEKKAFPGVHVQHHRR